jgi:hypothetical protein
MQYALVCILITTVFAAVPGTADPAPAGRTTVSLELASRSDRLIGGVLDIDLDQEGNCEVVLGVDKTAQRLICEGGQIFVDRDGDGRVSTVDGGGAGGRETFAVPFSYAGKAAEYELAMHRPRPGGMLLASRTCLKGRLGDQPVTVLDGNVNGIFGDEGDQICFGGDSAPVLAGKPVACGGELLLPTFDTADGKLHLDPYRGETATLVVRTRRDDVGGDVKLRETTSGFYCGGEIGSKALACVPGEYAFTRILLRHRQGESGQSPPMLVGGRSATPGTIDVKPGTNTIFVGPPFKLAFKGIPDKDKGADALQIAMVDLVGAAGEVYRAKTYGGKSGLDCLVRAGEKEQKLSSMDYG